MQKEIRLSRKFVSAFIKVLLTIWMLALFTLQVLLYPPAPFLQVIKKMGGSDSFTSLQSKVLPYFQTSDLNIEFAIQFND